MKVKSEFENYQEELGSEQTVPALPTAHMISEDSDGVIPENIDMANLSKEQRYHLATVYTAQIKVSYFQMALAFHSMKRFELYRELGYSTFADYAKNECNIGRDRANELVEAIDDYGAGERVKLLLETSPTKFLQVAKEVRRKKLMGDKLLLPSGEEVSAEEYLEERISDELSELRKKNKSLSRELENAKADSAHSEKQNQSLKEKLKIKEGEIDTLKQSKEIDPLRLQSIKEQRELERVIDEQTQAISNALKNLSEIPQEHRSNSLGIYLMRTIATMEVSLKALKMDWGAFIVQEKM